MKKMWLTEWHNINFNEFWKLDSNNIAGAEFYSEFYSRFFMKYNDWNVLDKKWIDQKTCISNFITNNICNKVGNSQSLKILSVGSGIGIIEKKIFENGIKNIYAQELSDKPLKWIKQILPEKNILIGNITDRLNQYESFDIIYLCAVDYALNDKELLELLQDIKKFLREKGILIIISATYLRQTFFITKYYIKIILRIILDKLNIKPLGQFWGYARTQKNYNQLMSKLLFNKIVDGIMCDNIYYIYGVK